MVAARNFFTKEQKNDLKRAIQSAELDTSGEIRVHIENVCEGDVLDRAADVFRMLDMHKTAQRNGVLIYLAIHNRKFAILGDKGINHQVPDNFWDEIKLQMLNHFREGHYLEGLCQAIEQSGQQLRTHFPYQSDDVNELSDDISFGNQ